MPELPEVEVLFRHLTPVLAGRRIRAVEVRKARVVRPEGPEDFAGRLPGCVVSSVSRRGKYLVFELANGDRRQRLVGHLGMTGRMYVRVQQLALPRHAAVRVDLGDCEWIFEDPRGFGRLTFDDRMLMGLGPEPLDAAFGPSGLAAALGPSSQPVKTRIMDQTVLAGVGNIYASEALFLAGISPQRMAGGLTALEIAALWAAIRRVLQEAIAFGVSVPLDFSGAAGGGSERLFYYGRVPGSVAAPVERFRVYDRGGSPCVSCGGAIRRIVQAGRSTYFCPACQH
jgi:formamidopyrimidine-DNA glycosylase